MNSFNINNLSFIISIPLWRLLRWGSPLPIPNREVKPTSADGTWSKARESMSMPILKKSSQKCGDFFLYNILCLPILATARSGPRISNSLRSQELLRDAIPIVIGIKKILTEMWGFFFVYYIMSPNNR